MAKTADTRWLSDTELAAWIPFSGMLIGLLSALDTQLRDTKLSLFSATWCSPRCPRRPNGPWQ